MKTKLILTLMILVAGLTAGAVAQIPDLIVFNARGESMDPRYPEVTALAVKDGRIIKVGSDREVLALARPSTARLDAAGAFMMPGFIDSHAHFRGVGSAERQLKLNGLKSYRAVIDMVVAEARRRKSGEWIVGRGWDQNLWSEKAFPNHAELSLLVPDHPVVLTRVDGHALLANKAAMDLARITRSTESPDGGEIIKDASGAPTGVFVDSAEDLINRVVPADDSGTQRADMLAAQKLCLSLGITMMHDAGMTRRQVEILDALYAKKALNMRLYVMLGVSSGEQAQLATAVPPRIAEHDERLWVRALKIYADGALGSRGAALLQSYADRPGHKGLLITRNDTLEAISELALQRGYQACVHAIGDRANRMILDTWESLFKRHPESASPRFRIEHAQILHHDDIARFASLGVIASMQAIHCTSDMAWVAARITADRARVGAYAWRRLLDHGAVLANGTDAPVEDLNPFAGIHAFTTRMTAEGEPRGGWFKDQCISRREALHAYTMAGAYAAFEENRLGSLTPGKLADFILLDTDLRTCPPAAILKTRVLWTFVGGHEVYRHE